MNEPLSHPIIVPPTTDGWTMDRLTEARGILVDAPRYADSLVILAARVVVGQTDSASERADAINLLRRLDRRPLPAVAAASFLKGGAA